MATILDGKLVRNGIQQELESAIKTLDSRPKLVIIQVGDVAESNTYIGQKIKFGENIGAEAEHVKFAQDVSQNELESSIQKLNSDSSVHGIIVQLPIPLSLNKDQILETIAPEKDVDGLHSVNLKKLTENDPTGYVPATTKGVLTLLDHYKIKTEGKHAVVIGRSTLVGKPTALALINRDATVTVCHHKTVDLKPYTQNADIIISAVGKPGLITKDHVKAGQTIIDVGTTVVDGKLKGDVAFEQVEPVVEYISPVPGGAGPLTVASLFQNLLQAYQNQNA